MESKKSSSQNGNEGLENDTQCKNGKNCARLYGSLPVKNVSSVDQSYNGNSKNYQDNRDWGCKKNSLKDCRHKGFSELSDIFNLPGKSRKGCLGNGSSKKTHRKELKRICKSKVSIRSC